jgi:hypothetical protein
MFLSEKILGIQRKIDIYIQKGKPFSHPHDTYNILGFDKSPINFSTLSVQNLLRQKHD